MDYHYSYRQRRSRPNQRISQEPNSLYRSSELDYSISGMGAGGGGNYFSTSGPGHFGADKQPRRSQSLDNRRDWFVSDDYGFPAVETDERYNGGAMRYQSHQQQRNYNYQPYLGVSTGPASGYRTIYNGRHGNDYYFDNLVNLKSNPTESDWDALDRSIRNYREDPGGEQIAATMRRSRAQSLSPVRPSRILGDGGIKSRRYNLPYFHRRSGAGGGFVGPQSGISVNRSESMRRNRNEFSVDPALQDEVEFGADRNTVNYYRGNNSNHQQSEYYGYGVGPATATNTIRGRKMMRGTTTSGERYGFGRQKYYKLQCCCLTFRWPPWAFEEVEPPQPIYRRPD
uniref:Uncharacterized protein n=1 Tax=Onchocerca volvulus TaxID=6282 RepID=A0A8R1U2P0_ONCVO